MHKKKLNQGRTVQFGTVFIRHTKINVEFSRMSGLKLQERLCPICEDGSVADGLHMLLGITA